MVELFVPYVCSGFAKCKDLALAVPVEAFATTSSSSFSSSSSSFVLTFVNLTVQCGMFLSFEEEGWDNDDNGVAWLCTFFFVFYLFLCVIIT